MAAPKKKKKKVVSANEFHLLGADGELRARLGTNPDDNPCLCLIGKSGHGQIYINLEDDGRPLVSMFNKKSECRAVLGLTKNEHVFIDVMNKACRPILHLEVAEDDQGKCKLVIDER